MASAARADLVADGVACLAGLQIDEGSAGAGSWGDPAGLGVRDTATVLTSLRAINEADSAAYLDGIDGLGALEPVNTDFRARRLAALLGSDAILDAEIDALLALQLEESGGGPDEPNYPEGGWGVTGSFGTDSLTTALALNALRASGVPLGLTVVDAKVTAPTQNVHPFTFPAGATGLSILVRRVTGSVRLFVQTPSAGTFFVDLADISSPGTLSGFPQQAGTYNIAIQSTSGSPNTYSFEVLFQTADFDVRRITRALAYLGEAQNSDGSWGLRRGEAGQLAITAEVLESLAGFGTAFVGPAVFSTAMDWIEDRQHDDGGFGQEATSTVYETALALLAFDAGGRTTPSIIDPAQAYLADAQENDGCWNGDDPYSTALALSVLFEPDDGLFCNGVEVCNVIEGCTTINVPACADEVACTVDACNEALDACTHTPSNAACNDNLFCNGIEICDETAGCVTQLTEYGEGGALDCDDHIDCTTDACSEAIDGCTHTPNDAACSDGAFCNGDETCSASYGCQAGSRNCADAHACTTDGCDEAGDVCTHAANNAACADTNVCTDDVCNLASGCTNLPNTVPCDDGDECTLNDTCAASQCTGTPDPECVVTTTTTTLPDLLCGDFNGSGTVTASDALGALRTAVGTASCILALCDFNGSGTVTAQDALAILRTAVGHQLTPNCPSAAAAAVVPSTTTTSTTTTTTTTLP